MRLCIGAFGKIICSAKVKGISNEKVFGEMTRAVDSSCEYSKNKHAVSKILSCTQNLSDGRVRYKKEALTSP